jgi:hypothetical protein
VFDFWGLLDGTILNGFFPERKPKINLEYMCVVAIIGIIAKFTFRCFSMECDGLKQSAKGLA